MDNNTKEILKEAGEGIKNLAIGVIKVACGALKFISQEIINLCDNTQSKPDNK